MKIFGHDDELAKLLKWQLYNRGYVNNTDGRIRYTTNGCRMSGDMNTALGNCIIMCAMVWTYFKDKGIHVSLANNGDDCVVIMESHEYDGLPDLPCWFEGMGFTMKVEEPVYEFESIVFCQTQPVYDGVGWRMVRDPRISLDKDIICIKSVQSFQEWKNRCQAISDGGKAAYGDLPIFCAFYKALDLGGKVGNEGMTTGFHFLAHRMTHKFDEPTQEARLSFYLAFGITPDRQSAIETYFSGLHLAYNPGPLDLILESTELLEL